MGITWLRVAAVTCGLVASAGLANVVSSQAQQPGPPTGTLQLEQRDRDARFRFIDVPPRQGERRPPNAGDGFLITGAVRDQAGQRAGRVQAVFVITAARREQAQGSATFVLADGHIAISGAETAANVDDFAITGGTGRYAGARGTLRVTEGRNTTGFLFTFMG
jgi:hypothetical protein